ncbi:MAG: hypothetical protein LBE18_11350 [Planctomycetaceae bacterium]|jgi:hypothetical protein|nr:hypothetical protein [Planctomycetaceae bacterium]
MLRQNPVKKRRGELNIERRLLRADFKPIIPQQELSVENVISKPAVIIDSSNNSEVTATVPDVNTVSAVSGFEQKSQSLINSTQSSYSDSISVTTNQSVATNQPVTTNQPVIKDQSAIVSCCGITTATPDSDWRIGQYKLPEILTYLATSGSESGNDDKIDFNSGILALLNDGLRKAREFDDKLFISIFENAIYASCRKDCCGIAKETLIQLQQIDGFNECYKTANNINEKWLQTVDKKLMRDSRIDKKRPLLMFPQLNNNLTSCDGIARFNIGNDYFVMFNDIGLAINPSRDFWEGLYQIGGVVSDVKCVAITEREKFDRNFIEQLRFYRNRQMAIGQESAVSSTKLQPIQFFVPSKIVSELPNILQELTSDIELIQTEDKEITISDDIKLLFQLDQLSLRVKTIEGIRWIRFIGRNGMLRDYSAGDILVFSVDNAERFFSVLGLSKMSDAGLTVFDISQSAVGLACLLKPVRKYISAAAVAGMNLVCDLAAGCFLDIVKGFDSDVNVWSFYSELDSCDDNLYYFADKFRERFPVENSDIIETFLTNRRRRYGLYFDNSSEK